MWRQPFNCKGLGMFFKFVTRFGINCHSQRRWKVLLLPAQHRGLDHEKCDGLRQLFAPIHDNAVLDEGAIAGSLLRQQLCFALNVIGVIRRSFWLKLIDTGDENRIARN